MVDKKVVTKRFAPDVVTVVPRLKVPKIFSPFQGFVDFVREQGVVGIAIGLIIGTQIKALVDQFIASFINPLLGLLLPGKGDLAKKTFQMQLNGKTDIFTWGVFAVQLISFVSVAAIVYLLVKSLKLEKLDRKKQ
jgi:large conductance mechanosensitive channel